MENAGKNQIINAYVPMSEFQTYAPDLRSMTGGRGIYCMEFSRYDFDFFFAKAHRMLGGVVAGIHST